MILITDYIEKNYEILDYKHAKSILSSEMANEMEDIIYVLENFELRKSSILEKGGNKSKVTKYLEKSFSKLGWNESKKPRAINCFKNKVALEIEWNSKDSVYSRDLYSFNELHSNKEISVGVIITRSKELQHLFDDLGIGEKYGASTTQLGKLEPKIDSGVSGECPVLVFAIKPSLYTEN